MGEPGEPKAVFPAGVFFALGLVLALAVIPGCAYAPPGGPDRAVSPAPAPPPPRAAARRTQERVAVIDFTNKTSYGRGRLGKSAADILVTELVEAELFTVVERDQLDKVIREQRLSLSDIIDPATAVEAGRLLGLQGILTGSVSEFGVSEEQMEFGIGRSKLYRVRTVVDVRVIEVKTGRVVAVATGQGELRKESPFFFGIGRTGGYDESLAGQALRMAVRQAVGRLAGKSFRLQ